MYFFPDILFVLFREKLSIFSQVDNIYKQVPNLYSSYQFDDKCLVDVATLKRLLLELREWTHCQLVKVIFAIRECNYPVNLRNIKWLSSKYAEVGREHSLVLC